MDASKVKDENYIHVCGWMVKRLKLKGNELLVYAIIYGFSQDGENRFTGSLQYLADWTGSTKQGVIKNLKSLVAKGYIHKDEKTINGVKFCEYYATQFNGVCNSVVQGMQQSLTGGMQQSLPNNIDIDNLEDTKEDIDIEPVQAPSIDVKRRPKKFAPPTVEEVRSYCEERNNGIDPQYFLDYYEARGWELSKGRKVKDWKACVRTWERNSTSYSKPSRNNYTQNKNKKQSQEHEAPKTVEDYKRAMCDFYNATPEQRAELGIYD